MWVAKRTCDRLRERLRRPLIADGGYHHISHDKQVTGRGTMVDKPFFPVSRPTRRGSWKPFWQTLLADSSCSRGTRAAQGGI